MIVAGTLLGGAKALTNAAEFAYSTFGAIKNPDQGHLVAAIGELTSGRSLEHMLTIMMQNRTGRRVLRHQPRVTDELLAAAGKCPEGSFGRAYADYMNKNQFLPSGRTAVRFISDPRLSYVMTRYRETHDFLHAAVGCGRTVEEEVALKMFEFVQTGLPLGALAVVGGMPHLSAEQAKGMLTSHRAWAMQNAPTDDGAIKFFLNVYWEDWLERPHADVLQFTGYKPFQPLRADF